MSASQDQVLCVFQEHFPFDCVSNDFNCEYFSCGGSEYKIIVDCSPTDTLHHSEECFLARFMLENNKVLPTDQDSTVLVLGCPSFGLPGVAALQLGYKNTTFVAQDAQRVQDIIWPSVFLNCVEQMSLTRCFSVPAKEEGGWLSLAADTVADASGSQRFDVILIPGFKQQDAQQLQKVLHRHLHSAGVCLVSMDTSLPAAPLSGQIQAAGYHCELLQQQEQEPQQDNDNMQVWRIQIAAE